MQQAIAHVALVVRDYDEAIDFYVGKLGFRLVEDRHQPDQGKRWVVVSPPGSSGIAFVRPPSEEPYGTVSVFEDLHGNRWDLLQYNGSTPYVAGLA